MFFNDEVREILKEIRQNEEDFHLIVSCLGANKKLKEKFQEHENILMDRLWELLEEYR